MKTDYVEIAPIPGQTACGSYRLFKRNLLLVERTGANFKIKRGIATTPGNGDAVYINVFGILKFSVPFNDGETVKAWYKL